MIEYFLRKPEKILNPLAEHVQLVCITLILSVILAALLTVISYMYKAAGYMLTQLFAVVYSIPSLALFALLIPVTGLGTKSAVIVLVAYNQYLLLENFLTGLSEVDPAVTEAAVGIGMTKLQALYLVQLPLAKKSIFAGIRLAVVSTIGIGTIAASINAGGLGTLLFEGLRTMNIVKILWGSLLSAGLAVFTNVILKWAENYSDRKVRNHAA